MPWAEVNGTFLRYCIDGQGDDSIVLVHEAGGCIESFDEVAALLADRFRVVRYDQRGFGHSQPSHDFDIGVAVADLAALIEYLAIPGPLHIAGCALGGDIGAFYASQNPGKVASLVITSPRSEPMDDARKQQFAAMSARIAAEGMTPLREGYLAGLYPESLRALDHERFVQYRARWSCNDPAAFSRLIGLLEKVDTLSIYPTITCATLVLSGTLDMSRPVEMGRAVAAMIPGARFEVLETGHFMAVQTPEPFAQAVRDFVATTSSRTG